ncbi:FadR/GntR family transcriptional regulator [Taklimakanibacter lacteus]|uniref:FadR/GntR family transcriptional regulator n=1 Tax=Taklimakanibacter lacteus TaxID=2268456 RepID=UPI0013C414AB
MDTPLVAHAVAAVREMISLPAYAQGVRLPSEAELAERIGISRPVLRQALAVLKDEGVIESRRGSGTYTCGKPAGASAYGKPETLADLEDCLRFRMVIESAAAAQAARHMERRALDEILAAVEALEKSPAHDDAVAQTDMAFHMAVARAAHSRYFVMTLNFLMPHILFGLNLGRQLQAMQPNATSRRVAAEHRAIYEAIASGNEASAGERMKDHLFAGIERVFGKRSW